MNLMNNYDEFMLDLLLESVKNDTTILVVSDRLDDMLSNINHPIAQEIISLYRYVPYDTRKTNYKVTLLDIDDKLNDKGEKILDSISFYNSNKIIEIVAKEHGIEMERGKELTKTQKDIIFKRILSDDKFFNSPGRTSASLGKVVKKLFPDSDYKDHEIGEFVEMYKSKNINNNVFELVKGDSIVYWYNSAHYGGENGIGPLHDSCMRYDRCRDYINFYAVNEEKISLLILKDPEDDTKIIGRAIVWKIDKVDDRKQKDRYFMDRIYYTKEYIKNLFIDYATSKGWYYKKYQNMDEATHIIDSVDGTAYKSIYVSNLNDNEYYPYMDTLKFYDDDGDISNDNRYVGSGYKKLVDTYGDYETSGYWSSYYEDYIDVESEYSEYSYCEWIDDYRSSEDCYWSDFYDIDIAKDYATENMYDCTDYCYDNDDCYRKNQDCFYSEYYSSYITNDYANDEMVNCNYSLDLIDTYRKKDDYITLSNGKTTTIDYANQHFKYSKTEDSWFAEGVMSKYYDDYIDLENAVSVILKNGDTDWRKGNDETWYYDEDKHKYYEK